MTVIYTSKLRKSGNSNVLTIPKELIKKLDISEGQPIAFTVVNGQIVLEAVKLVANESDILSIANQVSKQYDSALNNLVNR
ncbi:AbrB/MazE/SpoVT family DNA-binding domain-containing protein [Pseudomonas aeruginosa]|nr:AbrB/MazE/SpoVT family DNA-binding domain-containing protein [Pseudomonas aeruginosa]